MDSTDPEEEKTEVVDNKLVLKWSSGKEVSLENSGYLGQR